MKKAIGITACVLLGGCSSGAPTVHLGSDAGTKFPQQDIAPLPWVRTVPSERALAMKTVNFTTIAEQIRYDMNFAPHREKFKKVRLVFVDYTILPHETLSLPSMPDNKSPGNPSNDPSTMDKMNASTQPIKANTDDSTRYESRPQQYVLILSFYECDKFPPDTPSYEETIYMRTDKAPPQEALRLMAHEVIEDVHSSPEHLRKLKVSLD